MTLHLLATLRWMAPSLVPALLLLGIVYVSDRRREPLPLLLLVFVLGGGAKMLTAWLEARASTWTGLDAEAERAGSILFLFGLAAPIREASKVAAMWPAFRSRYFDEPIDGFVYAATSALGFAAVENALTLRDHPFGWVWIARTTIALPAHVFFACAWGYALGRAKRAKRPGPIFPFTWLVATATHGLYAHLVYGRGPAALVGTVPMLLAMVVPVVWAGRDLRMRDDPSSSMSTFLERPSLYVASSPPSLRAVRDAMRLQGHPIKVRWILIGILVTLGAMISGFAFAIAVGHWANIDFAMVDEHDASTTAPVLLLGAGILAAFPLSGYLVARASSCPTLLEPALASGLAIVVMLILLGITAPAAVVFALAFSPVAWGLACVGAWVGRPLSGPFS